MYQTKNNPRYWLIKLPVLFVYLLFFIVQIFFNLDVTHKPFSFSHTERFRKFKTLHTENITQCDNKVPGNAKIRLNKRFQPSNIPCTLPVTTEAPVVYASAIKTVLYGDDLYASVFLYTHSLRGPPVVA